LNFAENAKKQTQREKIVVVLFVGQSKENFH